MSLLRIIFLVTVLAILGHPLGCAATSIVMFGDDTLDTGNLWNATSGAQPNADYFDGRFTNGPMWIEYEAARRGLPAADLRPWTEGGRNFAYGWAETGSGSSHLGTPNVAMQISFYRSLNVPLTGDDLVVLSAGSNDLLFGDLSDPGIVVSSMVSNMTDSITTLIGEGATNFYIPNLLDLSKTPMGLSRADPAGLQSLVVNYNMALEGALQAIEGANPSLRIKRLDVFGILNGIIADPESHGFLDVTTPAYSGKPSDPPGQPLTGDPDTSLWWDAVHPTSRVAIPEPSALWLTMIAVLVVLKRHR